MWWVAHNKFSLDGKGIGKQGYLAFARSIFVVVLGFVYVEGGFSRMVTNNMEV